MDASQLRKRIQQGQRHISEQLRHLKQRRSLVRGNVYNLRRKCGKAGCRCEEGHLHESWVLAHLREGRFGKWLEGARDWAISRNRYWGTPCPYGGARMARKQSASGL